MTKIWLTIRGVYPKKIPDSLEVYLWSYTVKFWSISTDKDLTVWGCIYKYTTDRLCLYLQIYIWQIGVYLQIYSWQFGCALINIHIIVCRCIYKLTPDSLRVCQQIDTWQFGSESTNIYWQFGAVSTNINMTAWWCVYKYIPDSFGLY